MIVGTSFRYNLNYDYDSYKDCGSHGCNDEGICRCGTIENAHVLSVDIPSVVSEIYANHFDNSLATKRNSTINSILGGVSKEIDIYTIDRILRINKAYEPTNWEVQVCNGYYGQEIDDIILENSIAQKIEDEINEALSIINLTERIEYLLSLEYGQILSELKGRQYEVVTIERDKIIFGSENHYHKVATENLQHYNDKNYDSIRGVVISKGDKYRLIDGYHRCFASENRLVKVLDIR